MQHPPPKMISFSPPDPQQRWPQRSPGRCGTGDFFGCVYCSRLGWQCGSPWEVAVTGRTPDTPPSPQQKLVANSGNLNKTCWKRINMSTTIQKLLGFMLLFRCVMFAEYTIKTNCNWIIDSYRLWIRTLAFLWNSWDLYIMHGYYVFNKTEHLQTPQTSTIKHELLESLLAQSLTWLKLLAHFLLAILEIGMDGFPSIGLGLTLWVDLIEHMPLLLRFGSTNIGS